MNTACRRFLPCAALLPALLACRVRADVPAAPPPAASIAAARAAMQAHSLAGALAAMPDVSVAPGSVVLSVDPYRVMPAPPPPAAPGEAPAGDAASTAATPETVVATPENVAARYGRSFQVFGHVLALAPPTMTVLASNPEIAELPLSELAAQHPVPFLLGTLTQSQLQQMATAGLAFSDLSADQQALLRASLPHPFQVVPKAVNQPSQTMDDMKKTGAERADIDARIAEESRIYQLNTRTVPDDQILSSLRLYGFLAPQYSFDNPGIGVGYSQNGFETTGGDKLANGGMVMGLPGDNKLEAVLREEEPNAPKEGDLAWNRADLERNVSLQRVTTVGTLVSRLAKATGLELYADTHYEGQALLLRGDTVTAQPAGDVMKALALCVCGTWRRVGPAFVLTDDVQGLGARQEFLREMVQKWSNRLGDAGKAVGGHLSDLDWLHTMRFAPGDLGRLSPAQVEDIHKQQGSNGGHLRWGDLPAPLRAGLRGQLTRRYGDDGMTSFEAAGNTVARSLKPDTSVDVSLSLRLGVALPDTGIMTLGDAYRVQMPPAPPPGPAAVAAPPKAQANSITLDKPLRGLLCAPKTPAEARAVVALLPKMGLNALFLDVFTGGRAYFPSHALTPPTTEAGAVLGAALDAAGAQHVPVYAVLDLLCWRKDGAAAHPQPWTAPFSEDLTISGETPDGSVRRQLDAGTIREDFDREYEMVQKGGQGWASPLDPRVRALLPALVGDLAATKGLAGVVFQDTAPPGYLGLAQGQYADDEEGVALGYTPESRLVYLRTRHTDPVDLSSGFDTLQLWLPTDGFQVSFQVNVPGFQSFVFDDGTGWNTYRGDADKGLLAACFASARAAAPATPLFMRERRMGASFDPWTDPKALNQYASTNSLDNAFHQITPASILSVPYGPVERAHPDRLAWNLPGSGMVGEDGKRAGGEVFDLVTGGPPENLLDTLDKLNVFLKKP